MKTTSVGNAAARVPYSELEQKTRDLAAFLAVSEVLAGVPDLADLDETLARALDKTLEIMGQDFGGIMLLDEKVNKLVLRVFRGFSGQQVASICPNVGEGFAGKVVETGKSQMTEDMLTDPRVLHPDFVKKDKLRAFISVPLTTEGKVFGALNIASRSRRGFSIEEVRLLEGIGRQIAAAIENVRLHQNIRENKVRQELLHETFTIQEEERRRIARELHDETSQLLASLSANLEVAASMLPEGNEEVMSIIKKSQTLSTSILERTHKLIYQLRPTLLDDLGLVAATRWLVESSLGDADVKVVFKLKGRERRLPAKVETELFRVVQEIVANIIRHAKADNVTVMLNFHPDRIIVRISDNGCGFDVNEAVTSKKRPRGLGLLGMRERIELISGTIRIDTQPGGTGTTIDIDIPIKGEADGKD